MTKKSAPGRARSRTIAATVTLVAGLVLPWIPGPAAATAGPAVVSGDTPTSIRHESPVLDLPFGFRPEGIASHHGTLYVSSLADGRIVALNQRTGERRTVLRAVAGRSLRGMQVDSRTGLLYVAGSEGRHGIVLAVDRRTGHVEKRWTVPGAVFLNDLVVTTRGVWVTDSRVDRLVRLPLDDKGGPTDGDLRVVRLREPWPVPDPAGLRANGIRALDDGTLLLDHSTAGGLWQVSGKTGEIRRAKVTGGPKIIGGDGMERDGKRLWIVRGTARNSIAEYRIESREGRISARWIRELKHPSFDVPSTAVLSGDRLWAVNARFGVPDPGQANYWVTGLTLRKYSSVS